MRYMPQLQSWKNQCAYMKNDTIKGIGIKLKKKKRMNIIIYNKIKRINTSLIIEVDIEQDEHRFQIFE